MKQKLLLAFTLLSTMLFSQSQNIAFEDWKTNEGTQYFFYKNVIKTDASGNIYTLGATTNSNSTTDILFSKKNSSGVTLWTKQINGTANTHDFGAGIFQSGGDVYITGTITNNTLTLVPELFVAKYNSSGTQQFFTTYSNGYGDIGKDVILNVANNFVLVTGSSINSNGDADASVLAFNSSGVLQWDNFYDHAGLNDGGYKITTRNALCTVTGPVTISANNYKLASISYSVSNGLQSGTVTVGATATSSVEIVTDVVTDASGNFYICGATQQNVGQGYDYYLAKVTPSLTISWEQTYNSPDSLDDQAKGVKVDGSGNVYVTGFVTKSATGKDIQTIKYNSSGVMQWSVTVNSATNGNDEAFDMEIDASSNIYVTGTIEDTLNLLDYYTVKYNSNGTKIWDIESDGIHLNDRATNTALDSLNNVIVTGESESAPNTYQYTTFKYVQKDIITPTDFNGETPNANFMYFPNNGQITDTSFSQAPDVRFYTHATKPSFYFMDHSQSYVFSNIDTVLATIDTIHRIDLTFNTCNESAKTYPMEQQENGYLNYFMGYLPEEITNVHGNKRLITTELYSNIDLMTTSNQDGIKYYFIVKPGGDMRDIKLEFTGATSFSLNGTTNALSINSSKGSITFDKPVAYQITAGNATVAVTSFSPTWTTNGASNKYKFNDGTYTSSLTLIIEVDQGNSAIVTTTVAPNIEWSTNFGSTGFDSGGGTKVGSANNLYLIGINSTAALPQAPGVTALTTYQFANKGLLDGYIAKFDQTGVLKWRTYVGGSGHDQLSGFDIAGNGTGDLYCVGTTQSATMAVVSKAGTSVNNSTHASAGANRDGFIFQLNQNGKNCSWLTYYGGTGEDFLNNCKFDVYGNLFIIGATASNNFTVVGTAPQYTCSYIDNTSDYDGYVMKLNSSTFNIDWATYVGSSTVTASCSRDFLSAMAFDADYNLFVGGYSHGTNYPILQSTGSTTMAAQTNCMGDGIITQFTNSGQMLWSTYVPSAGKDAVQALITDVRDLYVGGYTSSTTTFPTKFSGSLYANTTKSVTPTGPNQESGFLLWFDYLNKVQHSTLIGGDDGDDQVTDMAMDAVHNIYLVGPTSSTSLDQPSGGNPINTWSENNKGLKDEFIFAVKNGTTDVIWSTEVGGDSQEAFSVGVTIDGNNKLFLSTRMQSTILFPWHDGGGTPVHFQGALTGGPNDYDGCITRFKLSNVNYVGVKEYSTIADGVFLYPNPTQGSLTIRLADSDQKKNFTIFNTMGQAISSGDLHSGLTTINVANLAEGMYLIEITDKTTKVTAKFIKQ